MDIDKVAGNVRAQESGIWIDYLGTDWKFLICYANSKRARLAIRNAMSRAGKKLRNQLDLPPEVADKLTVEWLAKHIVKDWKGVTSGGKALAFSEDACLSLLEKIPDATDFLANAARDVTNFGGARSDEVNAEGSPASADLKSVSAVDARV
jgi:hypothetical protein